MVDVNVKVFGSAENVLDSESSQYDLFQLDRQKEARKQVLESAKKQKKK